MEGSGLVVTYPTRGSGFTLPFIESYQEPNKTEVLFGSDIDLIEFLQKAMNFRIK